MPIERRVRVDPVAPDSKLGGGKSYYSSNHSEYDLESFILCSIVQGSRENVGEPEKVQEASMRHGLEPCQFICCPSQCLPASSFRVAPRFIVFAEHTVHLSRG